VIVNTVRVRFSPEAVQAIIAYAWPGNIREMENKMSRTVIMARDRVIQPGDLDLEPASAPQPASLRQTREKVERESLVEVLTRHRGNISQAAREPKVSRPTLHGLRDKHSIRGKGFR
jgi:two-component system NtrC family response regulator